MNRGFKKSFILMFVMIVFAIAINTFAVTIGEVLTVPEAEWIRCDDTEKGLVYEGPIWEEVPSPYRETFYLGTGKYVNAVGDANRLACSINFKFYGTKLRVIGSTYLDYPTQLAIYVDGTLKSNTNIQKPLARQAVLGEVTGLELGVHTIVIKELEPARWDFDAIDIDKTGYLITTATAIKLDSPISMKVGETKSITPIIIPEETDKKVKWTSDHPEIVTVNETTGEVKAISLGSATITATTLDGSNLTATCEVNVVNDSLPDNSANAILNITMTNGNTKQYTVSMIIVNNFISWYNNRASGSSGIPYFVIDKKENLAPYTKKTEYLVFDKISSFEVDEYAQ